MPATELRYFVRYRCVRCNQAMSWHRMMHSHGVCRHCGNVDRGTIVKCKQESVAFLRKRLIRWLPWPAVWVEVPKNAGNG